MHLAEPSSLTHIAAYIGRYQYLLQINTAQLHSMTADSRGHDDYKTSDTWLLDWCMVSLPVSDKLVST